MLVPRFLNDRKSLSENALAPTQRHNMSDTASIYHHTTHERYIQTNKTNTDSECRQAGEARDRAVRITVVPPSQTGSGRGTDAGREARAPAQYWAMALLSYTIYCL